METERNQLNEVRRRLLDLHKAVIDAERLTYEKLHGRQTAGAFLDVLVADQAFAWLRPWTALIVRLDDALDSSPADSDGAGPTDCLRVVRALTDVAEHQSDHHYANLLQQSPDVLLAHGALRRALSSVPSSR